MNELKRYINKYRQLKSFVVELKQAPRAWYERLDSYLQLENFRRGSADSNLYCKMVGDSMIIVEVYVYDIIFGSDNEKMSKEFAKRMQEEFEMSLLGELNFFLGLQIVQSEE